MKRKKRDFKRPLEFSLIMFASFILVIFLVQAASLPIPGGDSGVWGTKLNDYLTLEHNADGTHKAGIFTADIPSGAIMAFDLDSCPSGWTELTSARGRYIVGLPSGGTKGTTIGTALSNGEDRTVGKHNHGITDPGHFHSYNDAMNANAANVAAGTQGTVGSNTGSKVTDITINDAGSVDGTNAPYIQYLICRKG